MILDFAARERHFIDHLAPIWHATPAEHRGTFYTASDLGTHAEQAGISGRHMVSRQQNVPKGTQPVVVASYGDLKRVPPGRPVVFVEHGAGFHYGNTNASYSGGHGREAVTLFLCPNEAVATRNQAAYPSARTAVIGCPKLDTATVRPPLGRVVAVSFHFDCGVAPESRSAFSHYQGVMRRLGTREDLTVLGHGHPRAWARTPNLRSFWTRVGIEPVEHFADILDRADLYCVDTSSTAYEFAAAGRPVISLNSPRYRRSVHHGIRFWDHIPGPQVDHAADLLPTIRTVLADPSPWEHARQAAVTYVYGALDGKASERAWQAISDHLGT